MRQSERTGLYEAAVTALDESGLLYPCYCTRAEVRAEVRAAASAPHGPSGTVPYPGTCRDLTKRERAAREAAGRRPALRLNAQDAETGEILDGPPVVGFDDTLLGRVEGAVDDFVVMRSDGSAAYQLAVVVDDADQGVTRVVRGADLADSTPRQILLARLLGLPTPDYAHVPLVLGPDGERLAKRHGSVTLKDQRDLGHDPQAVLLWMARSLGLNVTEGGSLPESFVEGFDPEIIPKEPTIWNGLLPG